MLKCLQHTVTDQVLDSNLFTSYNSLGLKRWMMHFRCLIIRFFQVKYSYILFLIIQVPSIAQCCSIRDFDVLNYSQMITKDTIKLLHTFNPHIRLANLPWILYRNGEMRFLPKIVEMLLVKIRSLEIIYVAKESGRYGMTWKLQMYMPNVIQFLVSILCLIKYICVCVLWKELDLISFCHICL